MTSSNEYYPQSDVRLRLHQQTQTSMISEPHTEVFNLDIGPGQGSEYGQGARVNCERSERSFAKHPEDYGQKRIVLCEIG